mgnify:CR=1 FL=1
MAGGLRRPGRPSAAPREGRRARDGGARRREDPRDGQRFGAAAAPAQDRGELARGREALGRIRTKGRIRQRERIARRAEGGAGVPELDLDPVLENPSVNLINLRFTVSNTEQTWEGALWGRNLLDEEYYNFGLDIPVLGGYTGVTAPGVVYGVTVRFFL